MEKDVSFQGNVPGMITIRSNDVVLDRGGYTVSGSGFTGECVVATGVQNVVLRNGTLRNAGKFGGGIDLEGVSNSIFENLSLDGQQLRS